MKLIKKVWEPYLRDALDKEKETDFKHSIRLHSANKTFHLVIYILSHTLPQFIWWLTSDFSIYTTIKLLSIYIWYYYSTIAPFYLITHPLIFVRAHWTKRITWYKIGGRVSGNTPRPIWYLSSDFLVTRTNKESSKCLHSLISYGRKTKYTFSRIHACSDGEIKELVANAVPENTKKSTKYAVNVFEGKEKLRVNKNSNWVILSCRIV